MCKAFIRDFKHINRLTSSIYPEIPVVPVVDIIEECNNLPITNGILVNNTAENIHIINV